MKMSSVYPSNYLKAADLQGKFVSVNIAEVKIVDLGGNEERPVVFFEDKKRGLVLNKTNSNAIVNAYGDETDNWNGKPLELFPTETSFQGKMVPCIRLRIPVNGQAVPAQATAAAPNVQPIRPIDESEIPF
jgi:hypothetical protein